MALPKAPSMRSFIDGAMHSRVAETRMVWLPGAHDSAQDFRKAGFSAAVARRGAALDLEYVDLDLEHLGDRSVLQRLRSEVVLPAREAGITCWLAGISLGGLLALDYAATYPKDLFGLCLLAPYLGNRMLTAEIRGAPGLAAWAPGELAETDEERRIWRYIKTRPGDAGPIYLGFGRSDRFADSHRLLAGSLPENCVDVIEGGHEWPTWTTLWENFLDSRFI
jgi:pimeloyl-ACP methyl ester carboxylesterase